MLYTMAVIRTIGAPRLMIAKESALSSRLTIRLSANSLRDTPTAESSAGIMNREYFRFSMVPVRRRSCSGCCIPGPPFFLVLFRFAVFSFLDCTTNRRIPKEKAEHSCPAVHLFFYLFRMITVVGTMLSRTGSSQPLSHRIRMIVSASFSWNSGGSRFA